MGIKRKSLGDFLQGFAVRTGLEPATPGVTGRYSNQLNYRTICSDFMRFPLTRMQRYVFFLYLQIFSDFFSAFGMFCMQKNTEEHILRNLNF